MGNKSRLHFLPPRVKTQPPRIPTQQKPKPAAYAAQLYNSPAWKLLRRNVIRERGYRCERCGRTDGRIDLHHRVEVRDAPELALDPRNVELLCREEHLLETKNARAVRNGLPAPFPDVRPSAPRAPEPKPDPDKQRFIIV